MNATVLLAASAYLGMVEGPREAQAEPVTQRLHADVGVGFGMMLDWLAPGASGNTAVPCFLANLGFGGPSLRATLSWIGANRAAASEAPGRSYFSFHVVTRPAAFANASSSSYGNRVLRSLGLGFGPAYEALQKPRGNASRWGLSADLHVDLPLQPPSRSEGRIRLKAQRMWGISKATFAGSPVRDSVLQVGAAFVVLL